MNEPLSRIRALWATFPLPWKAGIVLALLLAVAGVVVAVTVVVHGVEARIYPHREAERAADRQKLEADRDAALQRATIAEARAVDADKQVAAERALLAGDEATVEAAVRNLKEAEDATQNAVDAAGPDDQSASERLVDIRTRLAQLEADAEARKRHNAHR